MGPFPVSSPYRCLRIPTHSRGPPVHLGLCSPRCWRLLEKSPSRVLALKQKWRRATQNTALLHEFRREANWLRSRISTALSSRNIKKGHSPKMALVSRSPSPRTNKPSSIHSPLSLTLRADAALHPIVLFKRHNTHAVILHLLACQPFPA